MSDQVKYVLDETRLPEAWYNLAADLPEPPLPCCTREPASPWEDRMLLTEPNAEWPRLA